MLTPQEGAVLLQGLEFTLVRRITQDLSVFKVPRMPLVSARKEAMSDTEFGLVI